MINRYASTECTKYELPQMGEGSKGDYPRILGMYFFRGYFLTHAQASCSLPMTSHAPTEEAESSTKRPRPVDDGSEDDGKNEPISLEELRDKMREREKELSRPKFLTKEQRTQIALQKRDEAAKEKMRKLEAINRERDEIFAGKRVGGGKRESERGGGAAERHAPPRRDDISPQELDRIKLKYLGAKPQKKKVIKPTEKFKFNFAWEVGDDTAPDTNPLYDRKYEAQLLFGRGFRAGIDSREQIQKQIDYEDISKDRKEKIGEREKEDQRRQDKERAREPEEQAQRLAARRRRLRELQRLRAQGKLSPEETQELDRMFEEEARPPVLSGDKVEAFSFAHPDAPRPPDPPAAPDPAPDPDPEPQ
eukprot:TRINITY_DN1217_c0_g1_i1.p1 TRINITY_DN1217_c0_g1~~TRINITY_DN1217_c0_g1_i1.p1  ORF type:complete len:363 (-),score=142.32 TRINITY_DN1217_c0_g1_i1:167-1255(-)